MKSSYFEEFKSKMYFIVVFITSGRNRIITIIYTLISTKYIKK